MKKLLILTTSILLLAAACNKQAAVQTGQNQQSLTYDQKMAMCKAIPNGSTQSVVATTRLNINLPKDVYPNKDKNLQFTNHGATAVSLPNGGPLGESETSGADLNKCWSYFYDFEGSGMTDLFVKSAIVGMPDYKVTFKVTAAVVPTPAPAQPTPVPPVISPMIFDVTKAKVGDKIGSMTITSIKDGAIVSFKGAVTISGTYSPQVSDLSSGCAQFRGLDSASLAKMPRISGDSRETWFCFSNIDSAKQKLGSTIKHPTITIDNYIIDNRQTETSNQAELISVPQ